MSIYRKAVNNPVTTTLIFVAFMVFGIFSLINTSIAQFPEFDSNTIMVMSSYQGANAADIETNLTKILENALNGVENLKELTRSQRRTSVSLHWSLNTERISRRPQTMSGTNWTW